MSGAADTTDPIPAQHWPQNEPRHHWLIRYYGPHSGPVQGLYTGPDESDAAHEIARLEAEGNRVIPPAASWSDPDAPRCRLCGAPFGEDREGGEVEEWQPGAGRRPRRKRRPGIVFCQRCAAELEENRENEIRRLQDEGGLSRKDAAAISRGDDQALFRVMEKRGVPWPDPEKTNCAMSEKAFNLYREAAIASILGDEGEAESKRNDARAEEFHLDRQNAIWRIQRWTGGEGEEAAKAVDEIVMQMSSRRRIDESAARYARDRAELRWWIFGLVLVAVAIGLGIFYWPDWLNSTVSLVRQCLGSAP